MYSHKVQSFIDEVVAKRLEQALHQGHAQAVDSWPTGEILRLSGKSLHRGVLIRLNVLIICLGLENDSTQRIEISR